MSYYQRPHELRLSISAEAEALISNFGREAGEEARRRAEEASNDFLARDWSEVAFVITRKTRRRLSLIARVAMSLRGLNNRPCAKLVPRIVR